MTNEGSRHVLPVGHWSLAIVAALVASVCSPASSEEQAPGPVRMLGEWRPLFQGIEHVELRATQPRPMRGHALRIDLKAPGVEFLATPSNGDRPAETDGARHVARTVASWVTVILGGFLNERGIRLDEFALARGGGSLALGRLRLASRLAAVLRPKLDGCISEPAAKRLFESAIESNEPVDALVATLDLAQVSDDDVLARAVGAVLDEHPREVERYRAGELKLVAFFMGEVMKKTRGKADPRRANEILQRSLGGSEGSRG
jgi:hypothetical protein